MTSKNDSSETQRKQLSKSNFLSHIQYEHLVGGTLGGAISTLIVHPVDLIRTRYAAVDGRTNSVPRYTSLLNAFSTIIRDEGRWAIYRGLIPNILGSGIGWGIYFETYNTLKRWLQDNDERARLGPGSHILCATGAGILTLIATNPIWVLKTRLCLQCNTEVLVLPKSKIYSGMVDAFMKIYRYEGIRGLYSGFTPGLIGVGHGAVHFMVYDEMKNVYNQYHNVPIHTELTSSEYLAFAAVSKVLATTVMYPYQVVRIRLQDQHKRYNGLWNCISQIIQFEGYGGFYKGLCATVIRIIPGTMLTFLIYEKSTYFLLTLRDEHTVQ